MAASKLHRPVGILFAAFMVPWLAGCSDDELHVLRSSGDTGEFTSSADSGSMNGLDGSSASFDSGDEPGFDGGEATDSGSISFDAGSPTPITDTGTPVADSGLVLPSRQRAFGGGRRFTAREPGHGSSSGYGLG